MFTGLLSLTADAFAEMLAIRRIDRLYAGIAAIARPQFSDVVHQ